MSAGFVRGPSGVPHQPEEATLIEVIAELAKDEAIIEAVNVLRDEGINGVMYDHLIAQEAFRSPGRHGLRR